MPLGKRDLLARVADGVGLARLLLHLRARRVLPTPYVTILNYHRVTPGGGPSFENRDEHVTPEQFDQQVAILKRYFNLVDVRRLDVHLREGSLPPNPAVITFDDGYRDNHDEALPILRRHRAPATFFVSTRYVAERRMFWWDQLQRLLDAARGSRFELTYPEPTSIDLTDEEGRGAATETVLDIAKAWVNLDMDRFIAGVAESAGVQRDAEEERRLGASLVMGWEHVRALTDAGFDVQSHGQSHRVLTTLSDEEALADLTAAREEIQEHTDRPVVGLAYPDGVAAAREIVTGAGYRLGFTSGTGVARAAQQADPLRLPRLSIGGGQDPSLFRATMALPGLAHPSARTIFALDD